MCAHACVRTCVRRSWHGLCHRKPSADRKSWRSLALSDVVVAEDMPPCVTSVLVVKASVTRLNGMH